MTSKNFWWRVPPVWEGGTCFIIGGGPSLRGMDLSRIHDQYVIGTNSAWELGSWVDVLFFSDFCWWEWNRKRVREEYRGLVVTCENKMGIEREPGIHHVLGRATNHRGIWPKPNAVAWNKSTGANAINLAYHFGVRTVVLLGFDMKVTTGAPNGGHNWHDRHFKCPEGTIYANRFLPPFQKIKEDADRLGLRILNATPDSALTLFPMVTLEGVLDGLEDSTADPGRDGMALRGDGLVSF